MGRSHRRARCRRRDGPALLSLLQRQSPLSNSDRTRTDPRNPASQFCGTNIGATILLARVLQLWAQSPDPHSHSHTHSHSGAQAGLTAGTRDGALYALALGSNFGAFTLTFSASLAGLLWRQILRQKGIHVRGRQFALVNAPVSVVAMCVGCAVLVGEVYVEHKGE